jgi:hypothetical protein
MARIEQVELQRHRDEIVSDVKRLIERYRAVFDWDVPDIDQAYADKLIILEVRAALDSIERDLVK